MYEILRRYLTHRLQREDFEMKRQENFDQVTLAVGHPFHCHCLSLGLSLGILSPTEAAAAAVLKR